MDLTEEIRQIDEMSDELKLDKVTNTKKQMLERLGLGGAQDRMRQKMEAHDFMMATAMAMQPAQCWRGIECLCF